jgi:hypothetical protein
VVTKRSKARWLRFSLRTLLVAVTLFGVWLGWWCHRARQQKASVEAITRLGGWSYYDFQLVNGKFDPQARSPIPKWLLDRLGYDYFHNVVEVNLVYNNNSGRRLENPVLTDEALARLGGLPKLRCLLLCKTQTSNDGLKHVGELRHLEELFMWDAREVTDAGIAHLADLRRLQYLHCSNSQITDESLRVLATLPRLKGLSLQGNRFTDKGLFYVRDMTQLTQLCVGLNPDREDEDGSSGPGRLHHNSRTEPRNAQDFDFAQYGAIALPSRKPPSRKPITDDGLVYVRKLVNLELLDLQKTQVTSRGLKNLEDLKNLKELWLSDSAVTDTSEIQKTLPNCKITGGSGG